MIRLSPKASAAATALTLLAAAATLPPAAEAEPGKVVLTIDGIAEVKGAIMVAVYGDQAGYDSDKTVTAVMVPVTGNSVSHTFEGVPAGKYGVKLFHDVNGNGKMDMNPFGAPIEPYAFSNNAKGQFGPAKWDAAAFDVPAGGATHTIKLQ